MFLQIQRGDGEITNRYSTQETLDKGRTIQLLQNHTNEQMKDEEVT